MQVDVRITIKSDSKKAKEKYDYFQKLPYPKECFFLKIL